MLFDFVFSYIAAVFSNFVQNDKEPKSLCETSYMEYGKQMEILYAHNSIRSKFSHDNGTSPSPAKDYKLEWNCDLERIAQFEANICNATIVPVSHKIVQKIFTKIHNNGTNKDIFKEAIDNWFNHNESKNIASLIQIGCGINHCPTNEGSLETLFVCLYFSRPKEITQFNKACQFDSDCSAYENSICNHNTNLCETSNSRGQNSLARTTSRKNPSLVLTSYKERCENEKLDETQRELFEISHNQFRSSIALGTSDISYMKGRTVSNMYTLRWNCALESKAQKRVDSCNYRSKSKNENIYVKRLSPNIIKTILVAIASWWEGGNHYDDKLLSFLQFIRAEATELGCGMNICTQGANKKLFIICKYGTRSESNSSSESLFKFGPPCKDDTDCTLYEQSTCLNHHGLCVRHIE